MTRWVHGSIMLHHEKKTDRSEGVTEESRLQNMSMRHSSVLFRLFLNYDSGILLKTLTLPPMLDS